MSSMLVQRTPHFLVSHFGRHFRPYYERLWKLSSGFVGNLDDCYVCNGWMGEKPSFKLRWRNLMALRTSTLAYMIPRSLGS
jgi:hypothetical protein